MFSSKVMFGLIRETFDDNHRRRSGDVIKITKMAHGAMQQQGIKNDRGGSYWERISRGDGVNLKGKQ